MSCRAHERGAGGKLDPGPGSKRMSRTQGGGSREVPEISEDVCIYCVKTRIHILGKLHSFLHCDL